MSALPSTDRNLLCAVLALQLDFVTRDHLLEAMSAWVLEKATPLPELLRRRGWLSDDDFAELERIVEGHLGRHGGDPRWSLAVVRLDEPLRRDLEALGDGEVQASLAPRTTPPAATAVGFDRGPTVRPEALWIGAGCRYRRLRAHARGGLGEVAVAHDEELKREVALKEIQARHADHPDARSRFMREALITGALEHPGIVPVYGLGSYPDGRPYYAMRFIRGEPMHDAIMRYHQAGPGAPAVERGLELRRLLGNFVAVCNAMAYAHARGVIHRDLKPANVMLGEYGEVLVVDWGLARLANGAPDETQPRAERPVRLGESGSAPTQMGQAMGTPAYMPPEQAQGRLDEMGPASDVFALGATLYHLLTGRPPYAGPDPLSQAERGEWAPARRVKPAVPAALEAVCARAMAARPADRYGSAKELAREVERFLADEPVSAYRDPLSVRAGRWARRNRTLVSSVGVLLLASVVGLGGGLYAVGAEKVKTEAALDRALGAEAAARANLAQSEKNLTLAKKAVDDCFNVAKDDTLLQGWQMKEVRRLLFAKAQPFYKDFRRTRPGDPAIVWEQADGLFRWAFIENEIGQKEKARVAFEQVRDIQQKLTKDQPRVPEHQRDLARTHNILGVLLRALGREQEALKAYDLARDIQVKLTTDQSGVLEHQQDLARTHNNRGLLLAELSRRPEALKAHEQARAIRLKLANAKPGVPEYQQGLATTHNNLGMLLRAMGRRPEALKSYEQALDIRLKLVKDHPGVPAYQQELAHTHNNLGVLLRALGRRPEALKSYEQARDIQVKLTSDYPGMPEYQQDLATTHNNLGVLLRVLGQQKEALKSYEQARDIYLKLTTDHRGLPAYQQGLARSHYNRGELLTDLGRRPEALKAYEQARNIQQQLTKDQFGVPEHQQDLARTHTNLGNLLDDLGQPQEALKAYEQARDIQVKLTTNHPGIPAYQHGLARSHFNLGVHLRNLRQSDASRASFTEVIRLAEKLTDEGQQSASTQSMLGGAFYHRAMLLAAAGRQREALPDWDRAVALSDGAQRQDNRLRRATTLAQVNEHGKAAAEARSLAPSPTLDVEQRYDLACVFALCSGAATADAAMPLPLRERLAEAHARRAVEQLSLVDRAGYFKKPANRAHLDKDSDLASLRGRADYRAFVATLPPLPAKPEK